MAPAGSAEGDGEDGEHPGVLACKTGEDAENTTPDEDEENNDYYPDGPDGGLVGGEKIPPVPAIGC